MNPDHPTWRYIPDHTPRRRHRGTWVRPTLFWTLTIVFAVGLTFVVPFGVLFVLPFMIGFLSTIRGDRNEPQQRQHPYDNL